MSHRTSNAQGGRPIPVFRLASLPLLVALVGCEQMITAPGAVDLLRRSDQTSAPIHLLETSPCSRTGGGSPGPLSDAIHPGSGRDLDLPAGCYEHEVRDRQEGSDRSGRGTPGREFIQRDQ
jgi:hypothetical protein